MPGHVLASLSLSAPSPASSQPAMLDKQIKRERKKIEFIRTPVTEAFAKALRVVSGSDTNLMFHNGTTDL